MSRHGSVTPSVRSEDSQISHLAQDLSLEELKALVERKAKRIHYLNIENEIFENYLLRRDPVILKENEEQQKLSRQKFEQEKSKSQMSVPSSCHSTSSFYSPKKKIIIPLKIRNEILVRNLEDMVVRHEKDLDVLDRKASRLRCAEEELRGRVCLVETILAKLRDPRQFESFVEVKTFIEILIRHSKERKHRIGLKLKTMLSNFKCLRSELEKKIDPSNAIKGVHFELARIENEKLKKTLQVACEELLKCKGVEDNLNEEHKRKLSQLGKSLLVFSNQIQDISQSSRHITWTKKQLEKVEKENAYLGEKIMMLEAVTSIFQTPRILDHVYLSRDLNQGHKKLTALQRQLALAEQTFQNKKSARGTWNKE